MKYLLQLASGEALTPSPIFKENLIAWCNRYIKKHQIQDYTFTVLDENREFVRNIEYKNGKRVQQAIWGGKRSNSGRKPIWKPREKVLNQFFLIKPI